MKTSFQRIITLLRKERGSSQKQVAEDLGISQALLSHYEKGIRECGLGFVIKCADYYGVSCDYLLGRTPDRSGSKLTFEDIPDEENFCDEKKFKGSLLPTLNKKLIFNSLTIVFDILEKSNCKGLTTEVSSYLMTSVYKIFRILYSSNPKNPQAMFSIPKELETGLSDALQSISEVKAKCISLGKSVNGMDILSKNSRPDLSPEIISKEYPKLASSLYNLIQNTEAKFIYTRKVSK